MNIAITGFCSGLAKALLPKLQREASVENIIGIDINECTEELKKVDFREADVRDAEAIRDALKNVDVVIHLAYIVKPKKYPKLKTIYDINVNGSKNVFQAAATNNVKKIIHLSSQSVYGHVEGCPPIVKEDALRRGIETKNFYYSHTKALVEEFLDQLEQEYPQIVVIRFRPPVITGPHFIQNLGTLKFEKRFTTVLPINHGGKMPLQLIHEEDLTDLLVLAIKNDMRGAFNVASNIIPDLEELMQQQYDIKVRRLPRFLLKVGIKFGRIWTGLQWGQAILYNSLLDTEKVEQELSWKPKYSSETCIEEINKLINQ